MQRCRRKRGDWSVRVRDSLASVHRYPKLVATPNGTRLYMASLRSRAGWSTCYDRSLLSPFTFASTTTLQLACYSLNGRSPTPTRSTWFCPTLGSIGRGCHSCGENTKRCPRAKRHYCWGSAGMFYWLLHFGSELNLYYQAALQDSSAVILQALRASEERIMTKINQQYIFHHFVYD